MTRSRRYYARVLRHDAHWLTAPAAPAIAAALFGRQDGTPVQLYTPTNDNGLIVQTLHADRYTPRTPMVHTFSAER
jgi:hypothetical protein